MTAIYSGRKVTACDLRLAPGDNLYIGPSAVKAALGGLTTLEEDLLTLAGSVYATDLGVKRGTLTSAVRTLHLSVEVTNIAALKPHLRHIEHCLYFLSNDNWSITLVPKDGKPEATQTWPTRDGAVLLFSGGLDSFVASTVLQAKYPALVLVSHITHNKVTEGCQKDLFGKLAVHGGTPPKHVPLRVYARTWKTAPFPKDQEREDSQRTRSFLFLTLAVLVARREGIRNVVTIAENGQFAIHLPLSSARVGPFSTHTAHPEFLHMAEVLFQSILDLPKLTITNPFVYTTKGEVVGQLPMDLYSVIPITVSCWRSSRLATQHHCGECIPCISRRIAVESNNLKFKEYERDLFSENSRTLDHSDAGKRNLVDLAEFIGHFSGRLSKSEGELLETYPELFNKHFDRDEVLKMYRRFAAEASKVLATYPKAKWVLQ
jgi:7-cyano-7-deazaguanine synthase in queuosine biosynthesis